MLPTAVRSHLRLSGFLQGGQGSQAPPPTRISRSHGRKVVLSLSSHKPGVLCTGSKIINPVSAAFQCVSSCCRSRSHGRKPEMSPAPLPSALPKVFGSSPRPPPFLAYKDPFLPHYLGCKQRKTFPLVHSRQKDHF